MCCCRVTAHAVVVEHALAVLAIWASCVMNAVMASMIRQMTTDEWFANVSMAAVMIELEKNIYYYFCYCWLLLLTVLLLLLPPSPPPPLLLFQFLLNYPIFLELLQVRLSPPKLCQQEGWLPPTERASAG